MFNKLNKQRLKIDGNFRNCNFITNRKDFKPLISFKEDTLKEVFDFSYNMTFGGEGFHRNFRSGGTHHRKNGELFINTFQGKLAEFGIHEYLSKKFAIDKPDLSLWGQGEWDSVDLDFNNKKMAIKSTKSIGNLLLLEKKDWDKEGNYIPNMTIGDSQYDYFILVRIDPNGETIMKKNKIYYSNSLDINSLKKLILNLDWKIDIPGFITNNDLKKIISDRNIILQNEYINKYTRMDADNYYCQSGDMKSIDLIFDQLENL
tara:strand:- start:407 stop:1186 length:780 start_codon:yes stop_codon:yes gene_type:complete